MKPPSRAFLRVLWCWWCGVRDPKRIRGNEFSTGFMLAVMFYLGFLYNTFHYFLYPGYIREQFFAGSKFWLHSFYGGTSSLSSFLMAGVGGCLGLRLLGKKINYPRWETMIFSLGFLTILPLPVGALLVLAGFTTPLGGVAFWYLPFFPKPLAAPVVVTLVVGILLFLRLFRSLGLGWGGLVVMMLAVPSFYFLLEGTYRAVERATISLGLPSLEAQYVMGIMWGLFQGLLAWVARGWLSRGHGSVRGVGG
ncbi:MAG: hypothetical protein DSO03_04230 [Hadesarchaea archaeon]|nr:MAG: hypothetical protein DSO03_04230 [Hadesarchaea archaeon]